VQEGFAENVVLNQCFTKIVNAWSAGNAGIGFNRNAPYNLIQYIHLGSGTTTPAAADTTLATYVTGVAVTTVSAEAAADNLTGNVVLRAVIDTGQRVGDVYREVGLASASATTAPNLATRALIVDGNGDPLTITKAELQVVTITSTVYVQLSHGYGSNLVFVGAGVSDYSANCLLGCLIGVIAQSYSGGGGWSSSAGGAFYVGSDATAPVVGDHHTNGIRTAVGTAIAATHTPDTNAKTITISGRVPVATTGIIREISYAKAIFISSSSPTMVPLFRLILPIGDNSPDFNDVFAADHIDKDATNVVDLSFVLQFGDA
jgi:hypothetical protein